MSAEVYEAGLVLLLVLQVMNRHKKIQGLPKVTIGWGDRALDPSSGAPCVQNWDGLLPTQATRQVGVRERAGAGGGGALPPSGRSQRRQNEDGF